MEQDYERVVNQMTSCFMGSLAKYPEKYQTIAYAEAARGKSYLEANAAMEDALKIDMSVDNEAGMALRRIVIDNVQYTRTCLNNLEKSK